MILEHERAQLFFPLFVFAREDPVSLPSKMEALAFKRKEQLTFVRPEDSEESENSRY